MATNKRPRKKYRPLTGRLTINQNKMFRFDAGSDAWMKTAPHEALDSIKRGDATARHFDTLVLRLHWGQRMERDHFESDEARESMDAAVRAVTSVAERHTRTGVFGATGEELRQMGEALVLIDEMQTQATRKELEASLMAVINRSNAELKAMQCPTQ